MNRNHKVGYMMAGLLALTAMLSIVVWADSSTPFGIRTINYIQSSRANESAYSPASLPAMAGNVTELTLTAIATTKSWQGYYGNISGTITLQDINGNVFYNWTNLEPRGEIFASTNNTVSWSSIECFNFTINTTINVSTEEARYGIAWNDADGIDETYASLGLDSNFFVGTRNITSVSSSTCRTTNTYRYGMLGVNDDFENVLLTDGAGALVFTTKIENSTVGSANDITGFNNNPYDFQLLVAENGHDGFDTTTTTYYFWAEID